MIRLLVAMLLAVMAMPCQVSSSGGLCPSIPRGYEWSPCITKQPALKVGFAPHFPGRGIVGEILQPGNYDVATVPFGDDWRTTAHGSITSAKLTKPSCLSIRARFPYNEPSAGYVILLRGPYDDGAEDHGAWRINGIRGGIVYGRTSRPIYSHVGARYDRYGFCGYPWLGNGGFPVPDVSGQVPVFGPRHFLSADKVALNACQTAPDVVILNAIDPQPVYISYAIVDMLGRETPISDPVIIPVPPIPLATYVVAQHNIPVPHGSCGFRVYAGYSPGDLHRQPVLDYSGSTDKFTWPLWLNQFVLHDIRTDTPTPSPCNCVKSLLSPAQAAVMNGANEIAQESGTYNLYCPFILHHDDTNRYRLITGKASYIHQAMWHGKQLETDIPLLLAQNFGDRMVDTQFTSGVALAGIAASDWNGSGAMSNRYERCSWNLYGGKDSVGFLVDERSSISLGTHTASEMTFSSCGFTATIPIQLEGNQTAKIRFVDNCGTYGTSTFTRYPADTCGLIYHACPNTVTFDFVEGTNGNYRSLIAMCSPYDPATLHVRNLYVDGGCPVYVSFSGFSGGTVNLWGGERINAGGVGWGRLCEAPMAFSATLKLSDIWYHPGVSSVSFVLNQMAIVSDIPVGDVVMPTEASWLAQGLQLQYPNSQDITNPTYFDFSNKRSLRYTSGFSDSFQGQ